MTSQPPAVRPAIYFLLACLLAIAVYFPGLSGDYVFDDMQNLLKNTRLPIKELNLENLQAASFFRPFWRRRFKTRRPAFVRMRTRKPCVFFRFRLLG